MRSVPLIRQIFIAEYLNDFNATRAYRASYGDTATDGSARVQACTLLTDHNILAC